MPAIVTVEEHTIIGGLGSAVAEVLAESDLLGGAQVPAHRHSRTCSRTGYGDQAGMMARYGIYGRKRSPRSCRNCSAAARSAARHAKPLGEWPAFDLH